MANLNKVLLVGRIGRDIELKYTQAGSAIANLSIATDESYTGQDGNKVQKTEWHRVVVYGKQAENCANYLHKGSMIFVEGSLSTRKWQNKQGQDQYVTEVKAQRVLFLESKNPDKNLDDSSEKERKATGKAAPDEDLVPF